MWQLRLHSAACCNRVTRAAVAARSRGMCKLHRWQPGGQPTGNLMQLQQRPPGGFARHAVMYRQACTPPLRKQSSVQCPLASAPMMYASCSLLRHCRCYTQ